MKKRNNNLLEMQFISFYLTLMHIYILVIMSIIDFQSGVDNLKAEIKTHVINLIDFMKDDKSIVPSKLLLINLE